MSQFTLKACRINKNLSREEVEQKTGISKATIYNYESGLTKPSAENVLKLCELYEVDISQVNFLSK